MNGFRGKSLMWTTFANVYSPSHAMQAPARIEGPEETTRIPQNSNITEHPNEM